MQPIPELPERIKKASNDGTLAIFIGAGVSRFMGCKDWRSLAVELIETCYGSGLIDFRGREHLMMCPDNKRIVSICYDKLGRERFMPILRTCFDPIPERPRVYKEIVELKGLCITTNADELLAAYYRPENVLIKPSEFRSQPFDRAYLYQIHGSISNPDSLVFTVPEYIRRYNTKEANVQPLLEYAFNTCTVLFLGYGFSEFELFDYMALKSSLLDNDEPRHVMLEPYYDSDDSLLDIDNLYYKHFNVEVLGYRKNDKGYDGLYRVLEQWNRDIQEQTQSNARTFRELEELIP